MELFYIDRQFGQAIFIEVEKGVVLRCYNESDKFNSKMDENYKGKTISFLREDFVARMKPTYHNVRPEALYDVHQEIRSWESRIKFNATKMSDYRVKGEASVQAIANWNDARVKKIRAETKLESEKARILKEHNYKS